MILHIEPSSGQFSDILFLRGLPPNISWHSKCSCRRLWKHVQAISQQGFLNSSLRLSRTMCFGNSSAHLHPLKILEVRLPDSTEGKMPGLHGTFWRSAMEDLNVLSQSGPIVYWEEPGVMPLTCHSWGVHASHRFSHIWRAEMCDGPLQSGWVNGRCCKITSSASDGNFLPYDDADIFWPSSGIFCTISWAEKLNHPLLVMDEKS